MKRKSEFQVQALDKFFAEGENPTYKEIQDYATFVGLTSEQVRKWFSDKRRRRKKNGGTKSLKQLDPFIQDRTKTSTLFPSKDNNTKAADENSPGEERRKAGLIQALLTPGYILSKVFRKDGPTLGVEFDSPPEGFLQCTGPMTPHLDAKCERGASKKRKNNNKESSPKKKHGMGKGLMTVWRVVNSQGGDFPPGIDFSDGQIDDLPQISTIALQTKKQQPVISLLKKKRLEKELQEKIRRSYKRRVMQPEFQKKEKHKQPRKEKCKLALEGILSSECFDQLAMLVDDEELELRELQSGSNPQKCSDHLESSGQTGCSLCQDLLPKFPPGSVKMKQPFGMQPWVSSSETVKKLFKAFHFLYTYAVKMDICPFTLDEFAQAFHYKDSLLLGKIHVALLKLLLSDVEMELSSRVLPHLSVSCKFLALLHSVESQEFIVEFWRKSLNPLTWVEILRQVLVAAGFGSKQGAFRREALSKEMSLMVKYGLRHDTLKCELFKLLSVQGNNGMRVSDLAKASSIIKLNLGNTTEELEHLINSTLSSDVTLFEKISSAAYRLRAVSLAKEPDDFQSDAEDSGSIDDDSSDSGACSTDDEYNSDSKNSFQRRKSHKSCHKNKTNMLTDNCEIDESHPGEVWLLGLMEGEYTDLSIEEKLNALVALTDLLSAGSSIRTENPKTIVERVPNVYTHGSGAKIKRSLSNQYKFYRPSWLHVGQENGLRTCTSSESCPVDSSLSISNCYSLEKSFSNKNGARQPNAGVNLHPMQSIFLGSDRRYNRYWLFLGPCDECDPGHRRIYFESSEDGHWEVIDSKEALRDLLSVLDDRGKREAVLIESLEKREAPLCQAMSNRLSYNIEVIRTHSGSSELDVVREDSSSPVSGVDNNFTQCVNDNSAHCGAIVIEAVKKGEEKQQKWRHLREYDGWIWDCFYLNLNAVKHGRSSCVESLARCEKCHDLYWRDEKHCKICHTTFELDFDLEERYAVHAATCREKEKNNVFPHKVLSSQLQSLKAAVHAIESAMPEEALVGAWTKSAHRLWVKRLRRTSSLSKLLQVLADLVAAINVDWLDHYIVEEGSFTIIEEIVACFPTMPQTSSAIALWLVKLDALIAPYLEKVHTGNQHESRTKSSGGRVSKQIEAAAAEDDRGGRSLICSL